MFFSCDQSIFQGRGANTFPLLWKMLHCVTYSTFCYFGALCKDSQYFTDRNILCFLVPTVIVGCKGNGGVTNFGLPSQFCLGKVGNSNNIYPPSPIKHFFC